MAVMQRQRQQGGEGEGSYHEFDYKSASAAAAVEKCQALLRTVKGLTQLDGVADERILE